MSELPYEQDYPNISQDSEQEIMNDELIDKEDGEIDPPLKEEFECLSAVKFDQNNTKEVIEDIRPLAFPKRFYWSYLSD